MSIDFSTLQGLTIPEGNVTQITDASGRVIWAVQNNEPAVLEVAKITADTYAGETAYTGEQFILLDIYPKTASSTVNVTYGGLTKTLAFSGTNAQQVFFGTFNGVSDSVATPASGELVIEGDYSAFAYGTYSEDSKGSTAYCNCITAINVWGNVKKIPDNAFCDCSLDGVVIPANVTSIGTLAFSSAVKTLTFTIKGLPTFGADVFKISGSSTTGYRKIYFEVDNMDWGRWASISPPYTHNDKESTTGGSYFQDWSVYINGALTSSVVGDIVIQNCSSISNYAFYYFSSITSVTLPENLTSIGAGAFLGCESLTSITIPDSVTSIGDNAFEKCKSITNATIGNGVKSIGINAFRYCGFTNITIPNSVTNIDAGAFSAVGNLSNITFENTSGWYVTTTKNGDISTGIAVDVSNSADNATLITSTYVLYYWYRA